LPHLWQRGGDILSADGKTAAFASQEGVDALTFLRDMAVDDKSVYLDQTDTNATPLFGSDRVAMMTAPPWALYDIGVTGTKYGVTLLPAFKVDHETISGPDLWVLFDHQDPNKAYWSFELAKWLTDPAQDLKVNVDYGNLPLRPVEMDTPEYKAQAQKLPGFDVLAKNLVNAKKVRPTIEAYAPLSEAVGQAIASVLQGQGDPKTALEEAAKTADQTLAN
jgi:multiple sugar transport system substrate-binding protein